MTYQKEKEYDTADTQVLRRREKRLRSSIRAGKYPTIYRFIPNVEAILLEFGFDPSQIYIPDPSLTIQQNKCERAKFNARRHYERQRNKVGKYKARKKTGENAINSVELERAKKKIVEVYQSVE